tara:strand:+ start:97 stop:273 length:177 start_codon:yes stop_codon:yes gene_type:complete
MNYLTNLRGAEGRLTFCPAKNWTKSPCPYKKICLTQTTANGVKKHGIVQQVVLTPKFC